MNRFYVYVLFDTSKSGKYHYDDLIFDYEPFYVGKGTDNRSYHTIFDKNNSFKKNKIKSLKRKNIKILSIKIFDNLEEDVSFEIEISLIRKIGRRDLNLGPLTNLTDGGDGRRNIIVSEETKQKLREINTKHAQNRKILGTDQHTPQMIEHLREINQGEKNPMFGKHHTEEVKETHSLRISGTNHPMFGKKHDSETIKKIKERRNQSVDQEKSNRISKEFNSKSVIQLTLDGEFIKEYESIKVASIETGLSESIIGKTCRGVIKKPGSFLFRFKNDKDKVLRNSFKIKVGDFVTINGVSYKLLKRNYRSFVVDSDGTLTSFRRKEYEFIWEKNEI